MGLPDEMNTKEYQDWVKMSVERIKNAPTLPDLTEKQRRELERAVTEYRLNGIKRTGTDPGSWYKSTL